MSQNFDWNNIRPFNGSQKDGFEELVCQLARNTKIEESRYFVKKGNPDAGVECFWRLNNGDEIAWQAKYFTAPLTNVQWSELDKSVKTAIVKHPCLKKYIISIPQDRADARLKDQKSFLQKWEKRVEKWEKWSLEKGLNILFEYEGSSELLNKLSQPQNNGKTYFWFNVYEFTEVWFKSQNESKIADLDARYSPEVNVELDISYVFNGLYLNKDFRNKTHLLLVLINDKFNDYLFDLNTKEYDFYFQIVNKIHKEYIEAITALDIENTQLYSKLVNIVKLTRSKLLGSKSEVFDVQYKSSDHQLKNDRIKPDKLGEGFKELEGQLYKIISAYHNFDAKLAEKPLLIIEGEAGTGKSHLIADTVNSKFTKGEFSIILLGQHFVSGNIWTQILNEIGVQIGKNEFLGALNAKAESIGSRIVIYIDAINEGEGKYIWKERIKGFIKDFQNYKYLGLVFTIRSTYKDIVLPDGIYNDVHHFEHRGLGENTKQAVQVFFDYYKLQEPPIPILNPEFSNPLFLKLFCKGLHDNGLRRIPNGYEGISTIFEYVIKAANKSISARLDYDWRVLNLVQESIDLLTPEITKTTSFVLTKNVAYKLLTEKMNVHVNNSRLILSELINESVLTENALFNRETGRFDNESIYFSYERFGDHLIVNSILKHEKTEITKSKQILATSRFYDYIDNNQSMNLNSGIIEALSIQLPEVVGYELYELISDNKVYDIGEGFLKSLIWRKPESITEKVHDYINEYIININGLDELFKDTLVQLSIRKDHYFNSRFLDAFLFKMKMNERDLYWTLYINESEYSPPFEMVKWVREREVISSIDEETIRLLSLILSWFLTSSNRELRDNTTKALVRLYENDLKLFTDLLRHFGKVNDLYILERLYAVAYGISLRSFDVDGLKVLAEYIFEEIFNGKVPIENILLRDYARGVIEYAYFKKILPEIDIRSIRPPYGSKLPSKIPTEHEIKIFEKETGVDTEKSRHEITQSKLYGLVMGTSDFARMEIGIDYNNSYHSQYSNITIESKIAYDRFYSESSKKTKESLTHLLGFAKDLYSRDLNPKLKPKLQNLIEKTLEETFENLFKLSKKKSKLLAEYIRNSGKSKNYFKGRFDMSIIQRLMIVDIFDIYEWDSKYFSNYDHRKINYFSKHDLNKKEAIGKKYIWMSYYKWLAILFDTNLIESDYSQNDKFNLYKGPWIPFKRDIDPTMLIRYSHHEENYEKRKTTFWSPDNVTSFKNQNDNDWCFDKESHLSPRNLIEVCDKKTKWLNLLCYASWGEEDYVNGKKRESWYHLKSYIIRKKDKEHTIKFLEGKRYFNSAIRNEFQSYEVFSREYYWSQAFNECTDDADWGPIYKESDLEANEGVITSVDFHWSEKADFSKDANISITRPSRFVFNLMDLNFGDNEHCFYNPKGELLAFNPAVEYQKGFESLLIKKEDFLNKLDENELDIIWLVLGAKEVIGSHKIIHESQVNNVFYFNENRELQGDIKLVEPDWKN